MHPFRDSLIALFLDFLVSKVFVSDIILAMLDTHHGVQCRSFFGRERGSGSVLHTKKENLRSDINTG